MHPNKSLITRQSIEICSIIQPDNQSFNFSSSSLIKNLRKITINNLEQQFWINQSPSLAMQVPTPNSNNSCQMQCNSSFLWLHSEHAPSWGQVYNETKYIKTYHVLNNNNKYCICKIAQKHFHEIGELKDNILS